MSLPRPVSRLAWAAQLFAAMHASRLEREKAQQSTPTQPAPVARQERPAKAAS